MTSPLPTRRRHWLGRGRPPRRNLSGARARTLGAICDIDEQRLQEVGAQHPDCRLTTDAADILSDPLIDVVSIASYDTHHGEQVLAAVNAGKHVFVEKPLCLTDREFEKIDAALCAHPEVQLSSNLVLRSFPQFQQRASEFSRARSGACFILKAITIMGALKSSLQAGAAKSRFTRSATVAQFT